MSRISPGGDASSDAQFAFQKWGCGQNMTVSVQRTVREESGSFVVGVGDLSAVAYEKRFDQGSEYAATKGPRVELQTKSGHFCKTSDSYSFERGNYTRGYR